MVGLACFIMVSVSVGDLWVGFLVVNLGLRYCDLFLFCGGFDCLGWFVWFGFDL